MADRSIDLSDLKRLHKVVIRVAREHRVPWRADRWEDLPALEKDAMAIALAEVFGRWTPVTERLPDDDITVMVACKDTDEPVWLGYHDADGWFSATDGVELTKLVTHWRQIVEPPNG